MPDNDDRNDDAVYKVDTVPPPDGDDDAYSAPTRIGPMAPAVVNELIMAKSRESAAQAAASQAKPRKAGGEAGGEEALDENDIEAELAFPPPPKVPAAGPGFAAPAPAPVPQHLKTQPMPAMTPRVNSTVPASLPPGSVPTPSRSPNAPLAIVKGLPPAVLAGGAAVLLILLGIVYALVAGRN